MSSNRVTVTELRENTIQYLKTEAGLVKMMMVGPDALKRVNDEIEKYQSRLPLGDNVIFIDEVATLRQIWSQQ